ncbi:MAG: hypothetical protein JWO36_2163 [Myxococcales bacterium]|nr:hypothetical protein [Myxococcales bacterium]
MMRRWAVIAGCLIGCGGGSVATRPSADLGIADHSELAAEDGFTPTYAKADLERALIAERGREASGERRVAELEAKDADDELRVARADLEVDRRFIASLEACQASGRTCPPRLDDPAWTFDMDSEGAKPSVDSPLRFDLEDWRKLAAELHGRACACRTVACVDGVGVAIDQLELRPMQDVQGDETASTSITRARECLFRLRGKSIAKRPEAP